MTIWIVTKHCLNKTRYKHHHPRPTKFLRIRLYQSIKSMHISFSVAELCTKYPSFFSLFFLLSNVTCTNIFLRISFRHTWMDLFESCLPNNVSGVYIYVYPRNKFISDASAHLQICNCINPLLTQAYNICP